MNTDRLQKLAQVIEENANHFRMATWLCNTDKDGNWSRNLEKFKHSCKTYACIGGFTEMLMAQENIASFFTEKELASINNIDASYQDERYSFVPQTILENAIMRYLDITEDQFKDLCYPEETTFGGTPYIEVENAKAAVMVINNFIDTGKVDWSITDYLIEQTKENSND